MSPSSTPVRLSAVCTVYGLRGSANTLYGRCAKGATGCVKSALTAVGLCGCAQLEMKKRHVPPSETERRRFGYTRAAARHDTHITIYYRVLQSTRRHSRRDDARCTFGPGAARSGRIRKKREVWRMNARRAHEAAVRRRVSTCCAGSQQRLAVAAAAPRRQVFRG